MTDLLNLLTLLGAVQGVFFGLVLLRLPLGNRTANRFLALFLLIFSLSMLGIVAYFSHWVLQHPHLALLHTPLGAVLGAPFLLYLQVMTRKKFRFTWQHGALFSPAFVVLVWLTPFYLLPGEEKRTILETSYTQFPVTWRNIFIFSNLANFAYLVSAYVIVLRHERVIRELYSSPSHKTLAWIRHFLYAGLAVFLTCVVLSVWDITWADAWSNLCFSITIYIFGYRAMRQPEIFSDISEDAMPEEESLPLVHPGGKYEKSGLSEARANALLEKLDRLMTEEQMYLEPELNLPQLALRLGVTPHQTSQLLNQFRGESFSDYVNRYRVEHFKRAVQDASNDHLSVLAIAFDSGFNSKAAFNAVFKKMTGLTPSQLRKTGA